MKTLIKVLANEQHAGLLQLLRCPAVVVGVWGLRGLNPRDDRTVLSAQLERLLHKAHPLARWLGVGWSPVGFNVLPEKASQVQVCAT